MKARSNLCWQLSETWTSFAVGTEMTFDSAVTVTSAPRRLSFFARYAISPKHSPGRRTPRSLPRRVTLASPSARMQKSAPGSPSFISVWPASACRQVEMRATSQSSASENALKNARARSVSKRSESANSCALRASPREALILHLLGRHVGRRADGADLRGLALRDQRGAEIADLHVGFAGVQDVGGLEVAVRDAEAMRELEGARALENHLHHPCRGKQAVGATVL